MSSITIEDSGRVNGRVVTGKGKPENVEYLIGRMIHERIELRVRRITVVLLVVCAFGYLGHLSTTLADLAGWAIYTLGLALLTTATAGIGFILAAVGNRKFRGLIRVATIMK